MSLPLLSYTSNLYPDTDLSGFGMIACQHLLGTTIDLFEELFNKGLRPENCWIIGKCYSTHEPTLHALKKMGIHVSTYSINFDPLLEYDTQFEGYIKEFAESAFSKLTETNKLIVLDVRIYPESRYGPREFVSKTGNDFEQLSNAREDKKSLNALPIYHSELVQ